MISHYPRLLLNVVSPVQYSLSWQNHLTLLVYSTTCVSSRKLYCHIAHPLIHPNLGFLSVSHWCLPCYINFQFIYIIVTIPWTHRAIGDAVVAKCPGQHPCTSSCIKAWPYPSWFIVYGLACTAINSWTTNIERGLQTLSIGHFTRVSWPWHDLVTMAVL